SLLVARRRLRLLGSQRCRSDRSIPGALPAALAAERLPHPLPRPGGGGDAARRRLGHPVARRGRRFVRGQSTRSAGIHAARATLAGGEFGISPFAEDAGIAPDGAVATGT